MRSLLASSPTTPRRNSSTQATKIAPWITSTHSPNGASLYCISNITNEPTTGPKIEPSPPTSVISTTSPDIGQLTSVSEASCTTIALVEPATPASVADSTKAPSL